MLLKNAAIILQKEVCVQLYKYQQHQYKKKKTKQTKSVIQIFSCQQFVNGFEGKQQRDHVKSNWILR